MAQQAGTDAAHTVFMVSAAETPGWVRQHITFIDAAVDLASRRLVSTYTAIAAGELATVTNDIPEVVGHPARSLEQVLAATDSAG
jgi:hypothetical protein